MENMGAGRYLEQVAEVLVVQVTLVKQMVVLLETMVKPIMLFTLLVAQVPQMGVMDGIIH